MHILIHDNTHTYPYSPDQLRADNPQTSFPFEIPTERLTDWGVYPVTLTPRPTVTYRQNLTEATPQQVDGVWTQIWVVEDASPEEIEARTSELANSIRSERNALLTASDWTQLADAPVDDLAWATYRQSLRDITLQSGFPWTVVWPDQP